MFVFAMCIQRDIICFWKSLSCDYSCKEHKKYTNELIKIKFVENSKKEALNIFSLHKSTTLPLTL